MKQYNVFIISYRYFIELTEFAWDQSEKFVKLFVNLEGVQNLDQNALKVTFKDTSVDIFVSDWNGKDCGMTINNLLHCIIKDTSFYKVKTGLIAIYLKKKAEGLHWSHLTKSEKRLKDKQEVMKEEMDSDSNNVDGAMLKIMKKLYQSGDAQTKQLIAKTWTESIQKVHEGDNTNLPIL